ncbi:MAG: hypothetical protein LAT65_17630 [Saccharospirillum sp.]|nr:hypothetical protein [Saccharospirillum sp.]
MSDSQDWLIKPENYRALQNIRKRIRSVYGEDVRITKVEDVETLFRYQNGTDAAINRMLEDFAQRSPQAVKEGWFKRIESDNSNKRVYRGQVVAA